MATQAQASAHPYRRPQDAASIILIDRPRAGAARVLMGKRSSAHAFMPGLYVFPGGKRDRRDHALPFCGDLHEAVLASLARASARPIGRRGARALALAALRELHEETGLAPLMQPHEDGPDLSPLRFVARAITPPGQIRRYDTRFFLGFTDEMRIDPQACADSSELGDLKWLDIDAISGVNMPAITRLVLEDVTNFMIGDPLPTFKTPARFYAVRGGQITREFL